MALEKCHKIPFICVFGLPATERRSGLCDEPQRPLVLVLTESAENRTRATVYLTAAGYAVAHASGPETLFGSLKGQRPFVIALDHQYPDALPGRNFGSFDRGFPTPCQ
jgi:hypothetical protein